MGSDTSTYITIIGLVLIVVVALLLVVVINQRKQIQSLKPKYGFLGKPLYVMILSFFSVGTLGLVYYSTNQPIQVEQTNANVEVVLSINVEPTENLREYKFRLTPILSGIAWGANDANKFNVYWTITAGSSVVSENEIDRSFTNSGGFTKKLQVGTNVIKVTVFFNGKSYTKEKIITVQ